ncbi:MAG: DNA polymerase IV [Actinophytocola sp.]|nr:DNA polymerase IV [Actinophytocola sp.]
MAWWVLHVDLDQFLAAVELLRRPELRGKPVIVGGQGDPAQRAVVSTASYEAREFGVRSGMPLRTAAKRCPDAVFLPVDADVYNAVSQQVMDTLRELGVPVEVLGWDEAYLGAETDDPEAFAAEIRRAVRAATELDCSVGIGDNRLRAKLATDFGKPAGVFRLTKDNWYDVMAGLPPDALLGVGGKTAKKLAAMGITTVAELAAADRHALAERFGPTMGPWIWYLAQGRGETEVSATPYVARSRSRETTFQQNLTARADVEREIVVLARRVAEDVVAEGRPAARVAVKVRFAPFETQSHSMTLPMPTSDAVDIERAALDVLGRFEPSRAVRLLGVRAEFERA